MAPRRPAFATDPATHAYYERRAAEYDDWWQSTGRFARRERPGWAGEVQHLVALLRVLAPARTLDVACGTGYLTQHLRSLVVGVDQSPAMVAIAQARLPDGLGTYVSLPTWSQRLDRALQAWRQPESETQRSARHGEVKAESRSAACVEPAPTASAATGPVQTTSQHKATETSRRT